MAPITVEFQTKAPLEASSTESMDGFEVAGLPFAELLAWAATLNPSDIEHFAPPKDGYPSWLTPICAFVQRHGATLDSRRWTLLKAAANLCRWGARLPPAFLAELEAIVGACAEEDVESLFPNDPWLSNFLLSLFEFKRGRSELKSHPWNISLPIADVCNARCVFCTSWIEGRRLISLAQMEAFGEVIEKAIYIGLVGHGEPLAHPDFADIGAFVAKRMDPRAISYTITNGVHLERWAPLLNDMRLRSVSVSLNAASPETHDLVMGLGVGAFEKVISGIRSLRNAQIYHGREPIEVAITLVVTQQNLHEIADFIRLGENLGVSSVWLRTLLPQSNLIDGLNYHTLAPTLHPDFEALLQRARAAIATAQVRVHGDPDDWRRPVLPEGVLERVANSPPRWVTRDETLKNRELRARNHELYAPKATGFRGGQLTRDDYVEIDWRVGGVHIRSAAKAWSWVLAAPVLARHDEGEAEIKVTVRTEVGRMGVGLWRASGSWIDRCMISPQDDGVVSLILPAGERDVLFVVDNCNAEGGPSIGEIDWPTYVAQSNSSQGRNSPVIDLRKSVVHNGRDPLNDGQNPQQRGAPYPCKATYYNLYINEMFFRLAPCCYMTHTPGYEDIRLTQSVPFESMWNSPALQALRRSLSRGPLYGACLKCPEAW